MFRQSFARLYSTFGQRRKLSLFVFLWTCLCLVILKSTRYSAPDYYDYYDEGPLQVAGKLHERAAPPPLGPAGWSLVDTRLATAQAEPEVGPQVGPQVETTTQASSGSGSTSSKLALANSLVPGGSCKYNYPSLFNLQFNNIHWQKFSIRASLLRKQQRERPAGSGNAASNETDATYYLYNAYYDDRWRGGLPSVRILAMIDRIQPPPTNCLLWSSSLRKLPVNPPGGANFGATSGNLEPLVTRASFVYAWYPKWGNYKDGLLQPWIVTCPIPAAMVGLVPDSVSLVAVPAVATAPLPAEAPANMVLTSPLQADSTGNLVEWNGRYFEPRNKRNAEQDSQPASMAMPPSFSSSSAPNAVHQSRQSAAGSTRPISGPTSEHLGYDCASVQGEPISNNLPVFNQRPKVKGKFAVCVKGLDFPHEDISIRLIEWIELLNLLGAGKIFLYELDVHENVSKVLHYYQKRGIVELSPLTLPGDQPNLPEYQHLYLKNRLTTKRQNELIPYNDCLYRNLHSFQYLALLDIDEIIMPMRPNDRNWFDLMGQVESLSLREQNYSRASYNVRNVYFFDDLAGPLATSGKNSKKSPTSGRALLDGDEEGEQPENIERGIPHYLHMMQHVYRSRNYTKPGQYVKCFHNTDRVVSLHNHFPMNCFGQCTTYSIPLELAHLQHYRKDCVGPLKQSCKNDYRAFTQRDTTIWKFKQQMIKRTTRVLNHLGLLAAGGRKEPTPEAAAAAA